MSDTRNVDAVFDAVTEQANLELSGMLETARRAKALPMGLLVATPEGPGVIVPKDFPREALPTREEWLALWPGHSDEEREAAGTIRRLHHVKIWRA